jgi:hypothetical protein
MDRAEVNRGETPNCKSWVSFSQQALEAISEPAIPTLTNKDLNVNVNVLDAKSGELFVKTAKRVSYRQVDQLKWTYAASL